MSTTVILIPTNQMADISVIKHIDLVLIPSARHAGLSDFIIPGDKSISIGVTGVPDGVKYDTTVSDLIDPQSLDFFCTEIAKMLMAVAPSWLYLPESGLASVPMKNSARLTLAVQAKINARVTEILDNHGHLEGVYLSLLSGRMSVPLVRMSAVHP
jgi:hypothetical protein